MNILIDIGHPGHVHLFRPFAQEMIKKGNDVLFTCRQKEFEIELLEAAGFDFVSFGTHYKKTTGKIWGLVKFDFLLLLQAIKYKPDLFLSHGSFYAAHASFFVRKPHISLEDTGNMEQIRLYMPFTEAVLTSDVFQRDLGEKQIKYSGYHELAYLHPDVYHPNEKVKDVLNLSATEKAVLIRFVSWNATHDVGQQGFSKAEKIKIVKKLSKKYRVFISSESTLPDEIALYKLNISPDRIHDVMAVMSLFIGEGATMASECAMLGTPAIYVNTMDAGTIQDQAQYGLVYHFKNSEPVLEKALQILNTDDIKETWGKLRDQMLSNKINVTKFLVWFITHWPNSLNEMKQNPDFQLRFK